MAPAESSEVATVISREIGIRKIGIKDLWQSLQEGFEDFNAKPSQGAFLSVIYPLFALLLTLFLIGQNLVYIAFPVVAGFTLIGPVVSVVLFEMSRRRESGLEVTWGSAFSFVHAPSFAAIVGLSLAMMLLYVAWLYMAHTLYSGLFGAAQLVSISDFTHQVLTTREGGALIFYGTAVGLIFAYTALAVSVVSFPLLLDKQVSAMTAVRTSVRAVTSNFLIMMVWGLIVVVLLAVGLILFVVGLAVVLPILGHSTWHLYRKLVEQ